MVVKGDLEKEKGVGSSLQARTSKKLPDLG